MVNRPEWIYAVFAIARIGAVFIPINSRLRTDDVGYILKQSDSTTLICAERSGPVDYLAMVLKDLGRLDDARRLGERVLAMRKRVLGPEHLDTMQSAHVLAMVLQDLGHLDESRVLYERVLTMRERVLGQHTDTAWTLHNLARVLKHLDRPDDARRLH